MGYYVVEDFQPPPKKFKALDKGVPYIRHLERHCDEMTSEVEYEMDEEVGVCGLDVSSWTADFFKVVWWRFKVVSHCASDSIRRDKLQAVASGVGRGNRTGELS